MLKLHKNSDSLLSIKQNLKTHFPDAFGIKKVAICTQCLFLTEEKIWMPATRYHCTLIIFHK